MNNAQCAVCASEWHTSTCCGTIWHFGIILQHEKCRHYCFSSHPSPLNVSSAFYVAHVFCELYAFCAHVSYGLTLETVIAQQGLMALWIEGTLWIPCVQWSRNERGNSYVVSSFGSILFTWLGSVLEEGRRQSSSYPSLITEAGGTAWQKRIATDVGEQLI